MKRLIKNKKGAFGLDGILTALSNFFQSVMQTLPKPVLFILFLFLLVVAGWIFSVLFHVAGVYCNSADQPVKLNGFLSGISLIGETPDYKLIGLNAIDVESIPLTPTVDTCSRQIPRNSLIIYEDGTEETTTTSQWFYQGSICGDQCEKVTVRERDDLGVTLNTFRGYCKGDVYRLAESDKTFFQKVSCTDSLFTSAICQPPNHYYYESTTNLYVCADETCETDTLGKAWDAKLASKGAKLLYPDATSELNPSSDNFVGATCEELKPHLSIYGINLFSFQIWVILTLIILVFWGWSKLSSN